MRFILCIILICGFGYPGSSQANRDAYQWNDSNLSRLLDARDFFRLEAVWKERKNELSEKARLYFQCFIDNGFNRNQQVVTGVDNLLTGFGKELSDSLKAGLLILQSDSFYKLYQYAKSARADSLVLADYSGSLSASRRSEINNQFITRAALRSIPPQEVFIRDGTTIHWEKDKNGLINIPVSIHGQTVNGIFDNGANVSCMSETYAKKTGLTLLNGITEVKGGITGISFNSRLGVADSFYIGDILCRNVVFLVMPDKVLQYGKIAVNMFVGYPIIEQLQEVRLLNDGRFIVPATPTQSSLHNMALDGRNSILFLSSGTDTLCFHLDIGASSTQLYATYFEKFKGTLTRNSRPEQIKLTGAGGEQTKNIFHLKKLDLTVGDKDIHLQNLPVFTEKLSVNERLYGNLGGDFLRNFNGFILNFKNMFFQAL